MDLEGVISCEDSMVVTNGRDESASFVQRSGCLGVAGRYDSSNQCLHARDHDQTEATQAIPPRESPIQVYKPGIYESIKAGE